MQSTSILCVAAGLLGLLAAVACGIEVDTSPDVPLDAVDAAEPAEAGSVADGPGPEDAGTGSGHIDLRSIFTVDVILNRADGGYDQAQSSVDGSNYVLLTQSAENALFGPGHTGVPDDGFFPANADHPDVRLDYSNDDFGLNARRLAPPGDGVTISLPARAFRRLQVIGISTEGTTTLTATIGYVEGLASTEVITFDDWATKNPTPPAFALARGLDRASINDASSPYADPYTHDLVVSGLRLSPDSGRVARDLTITCNETSKGSTRFHLLGVAGD